MNYADFPYYQGFFHGSLIQSEEDFRTFSERATEFINTITFNRLADSEKLKLHEEKVKKCVCALAEKFFCRSMIFSDGLPDVAKMPEISESIGAYSVSRANPFDYVREVSMSDAEFLKSLKTTAFLYLGNTGLLFRGVE